MQVSHLAALVAAATFAAPGSFDGTSPRTVRADIQFAATTARVPVRKPTQAPSKLTEPSKKKEDREGKDSEGSGTHRGGHGLKKECDQKKDPDKQKDRQCP